MGIALKRAELFPMNTLGSDNVCYVNYSKRNSHISSRVEHFGALSDGWQHVESQPFSTPSTAIIVAHSVSGNTDFQVIHSLRQAGDKLGQLTDELCQSDVAFVLRLV